MLSMGVSSFSLCSVPNGYEVSWWSIGKERQRAEQPHTTSPRLIVSSSGPSHDHAIAPKPSTLLPHPPLTLTLQQKQNSTIDCP